jgi:hypothetical protein
MRHLKFLSLLVLACLAALPALALPAPMTEAELMEKSDVVALMRVLSVTCTSITKDEQTGEDLPGYLATLKVIEVKKGDVKAGEEVLVTWRAVPKSMGPWTVYYYPGEEMVTHLTKRSGGVSYASTWWNAKGDDTKSPDSRDLPTTPGETVVPRPEPAMQTPL